MAILEKMMTAEQSWQEWTSFNYGRGCDEQGIRTILLDNGFSVYEANQMLADSADGTAQVTQAERTDNSASIEKRCWSNLHNAVTIENDKIELYAVENFLTDEECTQLIALIRGNNQPSTTTEEGVSDFRTSHTCDLAKLNQPLICEIDRRICQYMGIRPEESEEIQGQLYETGQQFKAHTDFFLNTSSTFAENIGHRGQRSWTFMLYLNTTREGGETVFSNLDITVKPTAGTALIWNNRLPDGSCNPDTLHCGSPVISGYKAILTKWFRTPQPGHVSNKENNENLPALTRNGFLLTDVPVETYKAVRDFYYSNRSKISREDIPKFIQGRSSEPPSHLVELPELLKTRVHEDLQPRVQNWIGDYVRPTYVYGIREYKRSAVLKMHRDRVHTHIASAIINIDQIADSTWPLVIEDHFYRQHTVYLKPGQMLLYEGAKLRHGRPTPFEGESYANVFVHYKLR